MTCQVCNKRSGTATRLRVQRASGTVETIELRVCEPCRADLTEEAWIEAIYVEDGGGPQVSVEDSQ